MDADIDLMALTEEIPDNEDLLDNDENSPVIRLINAIMGKKIAITSNTAQTTRHRFRAVLTREGFQLIMKKLEKILEGLGVRPIDTKDKDFDVDFHEAIAMVPGMGDDKKGKVIDCVQTGYKLNDKVIRHAKVAVGQ